MVGQCSICSIPRYERTHGSNDVNGKGAMYSASGKQKWKPQSLTEAELVGVHTNYPFDFLRERSHQPIERTTKILSTNTTNLKYYLAMEPDLTKQKFGMWTNDYERGVFPEKYPYGQFNSGDDVQSFAGAAWYSFVSHVVYRKTVLKSFNGHYRANSCGISYDILRTCDM